MKTLPEAILAYSHATSEGQVMSPKEFLHLGRRTAVDQAMSRLTREGHLLRVDRGAYVAPVQGRAGPRPPSAMKVVLSLATLSGELIAPDGAASARSLGLVEGAQVPPASFVTSGRSRTLVLGEVKVVLGHAPAWMLLSVSGAAGAAVRAIAWLGPDAAEGALAKLRRSLSNAEWLSLVACRAALPSWMSRAIGEAVARGAAGLSPRRPAHASARRRSGALGVGADSTDVPLPSQPVGSAAANRPKQA